jgi:putative ABC transport system permease protein
MKGMFPDLTVMTPLELAEREMKFTATSVPIGVVFGVGMMAGLVIGIVVSYQVLFNELNDLKPQYATLTAMGFSGWFLGRLVLEQALALCLLGFAFALPIVWYLFGLLARQTSMVMVLDFQRGLAIFGLTVIMCMVSALMAQQSVIRADPADLY